MAVELRPRRFAVLYTGRMTLACRVVSRDWRRGAVAVTIGMAAPLATDPLRCLPVLQR